MCHSSKNPVIKLEIQNTHNFQEFMSNIVITRFPIHISTSKQQNFQCVLLSGNSTSPDFSVLHDKMFTQKLLFVFQIKMESMIVIARFEVQMGKKKETLFY